MSRHIDDIREVMTLVTDNAPEDIVLTRAREAKTKLLDERAEIMSTIDLLDKLITTFAPDAAWKRGALYPEASGIPPLPSASAGSARKRIVLDIANTLLADDDSTITTKAIVEQLLSEGERGTPKNLATSVGNILTFSGKWRRVRTGEYEPVRGEQK